MIDIEQTVINKFPSLARQPELIRKPAMSLIKKNTHVDEINKFLQK